VVANRLLDAGKRVRVVGRSAHRLAALDSRGAEVVTGTVEDAAFVQRALDGALAAFVLLPPYFGAGIRAWQERTARALCDGLRAVPLARVVMLSSIGADLAQGNGPVAGLHAFERELSRVVGLSALRLRPGYFFENLVGAIPGIRATGTLSLAFRPDLKVVQIASRDIGEAAARHLMELDWTGHVVQELHGERDLTMSEVATALGSAIGIPDMKYVQRPYDEVHQLMVRGGVPDEAAGLYMEMTRGFNEGRVRPLQPRFAAAHGPTSIERWAVEVFAPVYAATAPRAEAEGAAPHA
jgi:uncharacterized protein YbjT (DUF2867 family)